MTDLRPDTRYRRIGETGAVMDPRPTVDDLDYRAVDLEIVEVIRVDGSDRRGVPGDAKVVDHAACRLRRVIPSFERGYRYRAYERTVDVAELDDFTSASLAS